MATEAQPGLNLRLASPMVITRVENAASENKATDSEDMATIMPPK
jgi:hypothetical protein